MFWVQLEPVQGNRITEYKVNRNEKSGKKNQKC